MLRNTLLLSALILAVFGMAMPAAGQYLEMLKIDADDAQKDSLYGAVTAVDGNIALVGAPKFGGDVGKCYLVDVITGLQLAEIPNPTGGGDRFGYSVDIDGNTAAIGAPRQNNWTGAAYIYDISDPTAPTLTASHTNPAGTGNTFGHDVAVSGNTVILGSRNDDKAHLYNGGTGALAGTIVASGIPGVDFGGFVSLEGNTAAISDGDGNGGTGAVHLFDVSNPAAPVAGAVLLGSASGFGFGNDQQGSLLAVGEIGWNGNRGLGHLFDVSDINSPALLANMAASDGGTGNLGYSVGIDDSAVVMGRRDDTAWVYDLTGTEIQTLTASDAALGFGAQGVSIDGNIVVGAQAANGFSGVDPVNECGAVYVFAIPEPSSLVLLTIGAFSLAAFAWRRKH